MKVTTKEMTVFAMLGALMYASKVIMEIAPNVHLLGTFTIAFTVVYRKKALYPIYTYVILNGILAGFATWWIPYLYKWTVLWGVIMMLPKKMPKKIINKFIAAIVLFFLPTIMNATMGLLGSTFIISDCWNAKLEVSYNPDYIKTTDNDKLKKSFLTNPSEYEHGNKKEDTSSSDGSATTATGKGNFVKYSMSDQQLKQITALALHEQGTTKGAAAEASLMANRFEMYGSKYGTGSAGLVNYVRSSGWFANAATHMADFGVVTSAAYSAVKQVLVEGKRTLPKSEISKNICLQPYSMHPVQ